MTEPEKTKEKKKRRAAPGAFFSFLLIIAIGVASLLIYQGPGIGAMFWNWRHNHNWDSILPPALSPTVPPEPTPSSTQTLTPTSTPTPTPVPTPIPSPAPSSTPPVVIRQSPLSAKFGMSLGEAWLGLPSSTLNSNFNDLNSLGIGWVRFDMQWDHIQPNNSVSYNWTDIDQFVAAANAHDIKLLPILDYTPTWARSPSCSASIGTDRCPPVDVSLYDNFALAAVKRYTPDGITDWEIWNEPNLKGSWEPAASSSAYAALLESAYLVIKAQNPSAVVISGGLGPSATGNGNIAPIDFLSELYQAGDEPYFNAVGDHPYSSPGTPLHYATWNAWSQIASTTPSLRSVMIANGDANKQIWFTEYGAPTGGPGVLESSATDTLFIGNPDHVTEAVQAAMYADAINAVQNFPWAGPLFFYSYKDLGTSENTVENFFGIIRYDGSTKPAYTTLKDLIGP